MTLWDERFDNHDLWSDLTELDKALTELPSPVDASEVEARERIRTLVELLREYKENGPKDLFTPRMLDSAKSSFSATISNVSLFKSDPEGQQDKIIQAAVDVDGVLDELSSWPNIPAPGQARAAGRAFKEHERTVREALEGFEDEFQRIASAKDSVSNQISALESQISDLLEKYRVSLEERETEYAEAINSVEQTGKDAYFTAIDRDLEGRRSDLDKFILNARNESLHAKAAAEEAREHVEQAKTAASFLSERAIATDFGEQARRKSAAGWLYDVMGALTGGIPLILILRHFLEDSTPEGNSLTVSIARASVTVAALIISAYLFNRGAQNHRQARNSKSADIRLRTLEAFISRLNADEAAEIRRGIAENIFLRGKLSEEDPEKDHNLLGALLRSTQREKENKDSDDEE